MNFKINFNSEKVKAIEEKFKKDVNAIFAQAAFLDEVGKTVIDRVKYQARIEAPYNAKESFPHLKESTIKHRKYLAKNNQVHDTFEATRSNLTITGQLLDALTYIVEGPGRLKVFFKGMHKPYRGESGQPIGKSVKNSDLAGWLSLKGFKVFDSAIAENKTLKSRIKTIVLRYIRRGLRVRSRL